MEAEGNGNKGTGGGPPTHVNKSNREACKRFNKGLCTNRRRCQFDHRCLECGSLDMGPIYAGED